MFVEDKRCRRSFVTIINGLTVSEAILEGLVEEEDSEDEHDFQVDEAQDDGQSFFIPESNNAFGATSQPRPAFGAGFNPEAPAFSLTKNFGENVNPEISKVFGTHAAPAFSAKFGESSTSTSIFGQQGARSSTQGSSAPLTSIFSKPAQPSAGEQPSNSWGQEGGLGTNAVSTSAFTFKSPFAPSNSPTTTTTETPTPTLTGFNFTKPTQPSTNNSGFSFGGNQIPQPSQPAQAPSTFQPPPSLSFDLKTSAPTPSSQTPSKPPSAFPAAVPTAGMFSSKSYSRTQCANMDLPQRRRLPSLYLNLTRLVRHQHRLL
jgi:hypothetical protein